MSNEEFLLRLEQLLQGKMPLQEIRNVMEYHREYFAEAGENAAAELDPPEVIAQRVLDEYFSPPAKRRCPAWVKSVVGAGLIVCLTLALIAVAKYYINPHRIRSSVYETTDTVLQAGTAIREDYGHGHDAITQVEQYACAGTDLATTKEGDQIFTTGNLKPFDAIFVEGVSDDVTIVRSNDYFVDMCHDNRETLDYSVKDNALHITGKVKSAFSAGFEKGYITVTVPWGASLSTIKVETDMGDIYLEGIDASEAELDTDLGNVSVTEGVFDTLDCDSDMGDVSVSAVQAASLKCVCDTGAVSAVEFDAQETELEADLGSITAIAVGSQGDYGLELEVDLGELKINGEKTASPYIKTTPGRNGRHLKAVADVGSVTLDFIQD